MKIWNENAGKVVSFITYEDLVAKVKEKFKLESTDIKLAMEDECEVDDDDGYSSGHLVLSHLGLAFVLILRPF